MKHALPLLLILALLTGLPACAPQAGSADLSPVPSRRIFPPPCSP